MHVRYIAVAAALLAMPALAAQPCESEYTSTRGLIRSASVGQGNEQKLMTKVVNAWRSYTSFDADGRATAVASLATAQALLTTSATKNVPPSTRTQLSRSLQQLSDCMTSHNVTGSATINVHVSVQNDTGSLDSVGAGTTICVDGLDAGTTDATGRAVIKVRPGTIVLSANRFGTQVGNEEVTIAAGETQTVEVILSDGKQVATPRIIIADEITDGILPSTFTTLTLHMLDDGDKPVLLKCLDSVAIEVPNETRNLRPSFVLGAKGEVLLKDVAVLRTFLQDRFGPFSLRVHGFDEQKHLIIGNISFELGRYRLSGKVIREGRPETGETFIRATMSRSGLTLRTVTDATGAFTFSSVPDGLVVIAAQLEKDGHAFYANQSLVLDADRTVQLSLAPASAAAQKVQPAEGSQYNAIVLSVDHGTISLTSERIVKLEQPPHAEPETPEDRQANKLSVWGFNETGTVVYHTVIRLQWLRSEFGGPVEIPITAVSIYAPQGTTQLHVKAWNPPLEATFKLDAAAKERQ